MNADRGTDSEAGEITLLPVAAVRVKQSTGRRRWWRWWGWLVLLGFVLPLCSIVGTMAVLPQVANHYNFALPSDSPAGLPYRVLYLNRMYASSDVCANAGWCSGRPVCLSEQAAAQQAPSVGNSTTLIEVGAVPTLFRLRAPYPVVAPSAALSSGASQSGTGEERGGQGGQGVNGTPPFAVFVRYREDCYINYGILGEP